MDCDRFDALTRAVASPRTRRAALVAAIAGALGGARFEQVDADRRDKRFRRRLKRRLKKLRRRVGGPQAPGGFCAGSNGCGTVRCGPNNACFCRIAQETGEVFCGGSAYFVLNCEECGGGTICVDLSACGGVGCAPACSDGN